MSDRKTVTDEANMDNAEVVSLLLVGRHVNSDLKKAAGWVGHLFLHGLPPEWQDNEKEAMKCFYDFVTLDQHSSLLFTEAYLSKSFSNQEK